MKSKEILILSGKGGTGKTTITGALAYWLEDKILVDADVDASNLPLLFAHQIIHQEPFKSGFVARKDEDLCTSCGICQEKCRFGAIDENFRIDPLACEGCGVCAWFCPEKAITMEEKEVGEIFYAESNHGPLIYAHLYPGEENSGKLVSEVKKKAKEWAEKKDLSYIVVDGSPGIGCPVIASISGADVVLLVAEPTISGLHDLERVIALIKHFRLPGALVINKADLNEQMAQKIKAAAQKQGLAILGEVPYDPQVFQAVQKGKPIPDIIDQSPVVEALKEIYEKFRQNCMD